MDIERRTLVAALAALACSNAATRAEDRDPGRLIAPTGTLRIGVYPGSPTSLVRDGSGEDRGVTVELGRALAGQLGVPSALVVYPRIAEVLVALNAGDLDVTISNATPLRAESVAFAEPLLALELGYLVPAGSSIGTAAQMRGARVGVTMGGTSQRTLAERLPEAVIVPVPALERAAELLRAGQLDAFATNKAVLFQISDDLPGSRVLDGRWGLEHLAIAIPKGREAALPILEDFTRRVRADGRLAGAIRRSGLRGLAHPAGAP